MTTHEGVVTNAVGLFEIAGDFYYDLKTISCGSAVMAEKSSASSAIYLTNLYHNQRTKWFKGNLGTSQGMADVANYLYDGRTPEHGSGKYLQSVQQLGNSIMQDWARQGNTIGPPGSTTPQIVKDDSPLSPADVQNAPQRGIGPFVPADNTHVTVKPPEKQDARPSDD